MKLGDMDTNWDVVIAGGGITGAGIFVEAVLQGFKTLLVEQQDFAWGTSSRSSKLVHGGLRYLKQGKLNLTLQSVRERQRLLASESGLISPLQFFMPVYKHHGPSRQMMNLGLSLYSLMAMKKQHRQWSPQEASGHWPFVNSRDMTAGFSFMDAQTDDARLVLKLIAQGQSLGGTALNYTTLCEVGRDNRGNARAAVLQDTEYKTTLDVTAGVVINATGAWADKLQPFPAKGYKLRPLRGSHLVFPGNLFPVRDAISVCHPKDNRPVFILPWEGSTLVGTTDMDHEESLAKEPAISHKEAEYLMEAIRFATPGLNLREQDCIGSFAGVRPVLSRGKNSASNESREHMVLDTKGLITITGGKLTTFRHVALDVLAIVRRSLKPPSKSIPYQGNRIENRMDEASGVTSDLPPDIRLRLLGRYGPAAASAIQAATDYSQAYVPGTQTLWSEIVYAAKNEQVRHLSDLMLRRVRVGLVMARGGSAVLDRVQEVCSPFLSWEKQRWETEKQLYRKTWKSCYNSPFAD